MVCLGEAPPTVPVHLTGRVTSRATPPPFATYRNEVIKLCIVVIITRFFSRVFYRPMRQYLLIQNVQAELRFCRGRWLLLEPPGAGYRGLDDYAQQQHHASSLFLAATNLRPCACPD